VSVDKELNLLLMSVGDVDMDAGLRYGGFIAGATSNPRTGKRKETSFAGSAKGPLPRLRIFAIFGPISNPKQVQRCRHCRGLHTHTLVVAYDNDNVFIATCRGFVCA